MIRTETGPGALAPGADRVIAGRQPRSYSPPRAAKKEPAALCALRRQRAVARICERPRLVAELLDELGRAHGIAADIEARVLRYAAADPAILAALGGDRFPPAPLHLVEGEP